MSFEKPAAGGPSPEDRERIDRAKKEFKELTEFIGREARREKSPRHLKFTEAEYGSRKFCNIRYFDKDTKAVVSEEIQLDPSLLLEGPPGAFYAVLWHEFGHGEPEYREVELAFENDYADLIASDKPAADFLLNLKLDLFIDADNLKKRSGLSSAYRALNEEFFPEAGKEHLSRLAGLAEKHGQGADAVKLGKRLRGPLGADGEYLLGLKHEAFWHQEHESQGTASGHRLPNPYERLDPDIAEALKKTRADALALVHATWPMEDRSRAFDEKIAPVVAALKERKRARLIERLGGWVASGEQALEDVRGLVTGLVLERISPQVEELRQSLNDLGVVLENLSDSIKRADKALPDFEKLVAETDRAGDPDASDSIRKSMENVRAKRSADREAQAAIRQRIASEESRLQAVLALLPKPYAEVEEAVDALLAELGRHAPEPPPGPPHASEQSQEIDENDSRHPENPEFSENFPDAKPDRNHSEKPVPGGDKAGQEKKGRLQEAKFGEPSPEDVREARRIRNLIEPVELERLATGLTLAFIEDREREIIKDLPHGRMPQARKAEAVRRRYAGERVPEVREISRRSESFMSVDLIVINDHSGSMYGEKEDAAKAANLALADAALRVNTEIAARLRGRGLSDAELRAVSPVRYSGILFSDDVALLNSEGWDTPLEKKGMLAAEQELERERFSAGLMAGYRKMKMGDNSDGQAAALALYQAFGAEKSAFARHEERVKVLVFLADGGPSDVHALTELMAYLHLKSDRFPPLIRAHIDAIESGAGERVLAALGKYRDQVFALSVGIHDEDGWGRSELARIYNEGKMPVSGDVASEDGNLILLPTSRVRELPGLLLKLVNGKFNSRRFRAVRERFRERGRRARRNKG